MYQLTLYGIHRGIGVTILPTGIPGHHTTGIIITDTIRTITATITGITITVITTVTRIMPIITTPKTGHILTR